MKKPGLTPGSFGCENLLCSLTAISASRAASRAHRRIGGAGRTHSASIRCPSRSRLGRRAGRSGSRHRRRRGCCRRRCRSYRRGGRGAGLRSGAGLCGRTGLSECDTGRHGQTRRCGDDCLRSHLNSLCNSSELARLVAPREICRQRTCPSLLMCLGSVYSFPDLRGYAPRLTRNTGHRACWLR